MNVRHVRTLAALAAVAAGFAAAQRPAAATGQQQYDCGDPTGAEQQVLEMINRARANPTAEGQRLHIDINEGLPAGNTAVPRPPLAMNKDLLASARAHSQDMYVRKYFDHVDPDGHDPYFRMTAAGYTYVAPNAGENIAVSSKSAPAGLEDLLMVDAGEPGRGHRVNLLNTDTVHLYREVGVGYYSGATPIAGASDPNLDGLKDFLTQDFGSSATGPFVLGVVYTDTNHNGVYDPGEGLAGVTVAPDSGGWFAVTGTAGGFAFPVGTSGSITVTASGGPMWESMSAPVVLSGANAKVDFVVPPAPTATPHVLNLGLNFRPAGNDTMKLVAAVANVTLPADLTGLQVTVVVGEITRTLTLDATGKAAAGDAKVTVKRGKGYGPDKVTLVVKGTDFTAPTPFTAEGMDGTASAKNLRVPISGSIDLGSGPVAFSVAVKYNAKAGRSGTAVLTK
jgi:uncharacterized protein YkwD